MSSSRSAVVVRSGRGVGASSEASGTAFACSSAWKGAVVDRTAAERTAERQNGSGSSLLISTTTKNNNNINNNNTSTSTSTSKKAFYHQQEGV